MEVYRKEDFTQRRKAKPQRRREESGTALCAFAALLCAFA
jgi:hypothetical protein